MRLLDLTGIFGKYKSRLSHPENFHVLGSNFNLLKKDDINAESFLSHLIHGTVDQQKKYYNQSFNNLYANNIIKKEWRGHLEAINSIEFIEEPICLVTVSKDMHLRIWDEKMELIGEINVFQNEKHKFTKPKLCPWQFKVNEKAILEREINEIIEMIEYVGIKPFEFGSKEDMENSKLKNVEIKEETKAVKRLDTKEEQKEEKKKEKENVDNRMNKFEFTTQYEALFLQNLVSNIDFLLQNNHDKEGFAEISNHIIDSIIVQKEKEKDKDKFEDNYETTTKDKRGAILTSTLKNNKTNDKSKSKTSSKIIYPEKDIDIKSENLEYEKVKKKKFEPKLYKTKFGNTFTPGKLGRLILNLNKNDTNNKESSKFNSINNSEINPNVNEINIQDNTNSKRIIKFSDTLRNKIINDKILDKGSKKVIFNKMYKTNNIYPKVLSNRKSLLRRNFSSGYIQINGFENVSKISKRPKTGKDNHMLALNHIPNNIDRNTLYSERLFLNSSTLLSQTKSKFFPSLKEKLAEVHKNNLLNINMKEKTEDIFKNQFYLNSYKNCCKIIPNNSISTNASIILNYKNMWNNVKSYTNNLKAKNSARIRKITPSKKKVIRSRSVSALISKF